MFSVGDTREFVVYIYIEPSELQEVDVSPLSLSSLVITTRDRT
jgi:hypothetical protein